MDRLSRLDRQLARVSGLVEDQRRRLYAAVSAASTPVSRDEAAAAVGISRSLAAYHLDRLVADGLLEVRFERRTGRSGPGAGRPAKLYSPSDQPVEISVPAREYAFLAELMARAIENEPSGAARAAFLDAARQVGAEAVLTSATGQTGAGPEAVNVALAEAGYEPYTDADGMVRLRNCPFHRLAERHRELVCSGNLALIEELTERLASRQSSRLDPRPGECCVALAPCSGADQAAGRSSKTNNS